MYSTGESSYYFDTQQLCMNQQTTIFNESCSDDKDFVRNQAEQMPFQSLVYNQVWGNTEPTLLELYSPVRDYSPHHVTHSTNYSSYQTSKESTADMIGSDFIPRTLIFTDFEDEPPLLEELGIQRNEIVQKTMAALNPMRKVDASVLQSTDLAGPLVFVLGFGGCLLLSGKVHFNYVYAIVALGCLAMNFLVNQMSRITLSLSVTVSILGYCLLPLVILAGVNIFISLKSTGGIILTILIVLWCSWSASKLLVTVLSMDHDQPLVAYPCALLYTALALLTIF